MRWLDWLTSHSPTPPSAVESSSAVSVDIVYEQVIRTIDAQHDHISAIDAKASFVLAAASIVIGFQGLPGAGNSFGIRNPLWLAPAFVIYVALVSSIFQAYRLREFKSHGMDPAELQTYYYDTVEFTKRQIVATMRQAYEENIPKIEEKVCWLQRAERLLVAEVVMLVLGGILSHEWERAQRLICVVWNWIT